MRELLVEIKVESHLSGETDQSQLDCNNKVSPIPSPRHVCRVAVQLKKHREPRFSKVLTH